MMALLRRLASDEEGATMVEYALMIALIGAALITVVTSLKTALSSKFTTISTSVSAAS